MNNNNKIDILRQLLDIYFPDLNITIVSSDSINIQLLFNNIKICFFNIDDIACAFRDVSHELYFYDHNLSLSIFRLILDKINKHKLVSSNELKYIDRLDDEQLLRYINLILREDEKYTQYRNIYDPKRLRSAIYLDILA